VKLEKPFLESPSIRALRFGEALVSKKGRIPPLDGVMSPGFPVRLFREAKQPLTLVDVPPGAVDHILRRERGTLIMPASVDPPTGPVLSRFVAKVALEAMAAKLVEHADGLEYLATEPQLDGIRDHARRGTVPDWPVHVRRIYAANAEWFDESGNSVQLVHESDILQTDSNEWYFVLALFGWELVINYGGPEVDGYRRWLIEHTGESPLYVGKNASSGVRRAG
jgi:hypothetical protein